MYASKLYFKMYLYQLEFLELLEISENALISDGPSKNEQPDIVMLLANFAEK
jgi:hypothetical protein